MSVNNLSAHGRAYYSGASQSELPLSLINKMKSLGINPDEAGSVAEAYNLIKEAQKNQNVQNAQNSSNDEAKNNNEESSAARDEAVELANKIGVKVSENDSAEDIISKLKSYIEKMLSYAVDTYDKALYDKFSEYKRLLKDIETKESGGTFSDTNVFSFMDMVAQQNKFALNLGNKEEKIDKIG